MKACRLADHRLFQVDGRCFLFLPGQNAIFEVEENIRSLIDTYSHSRNRLNADIRQQEEKLPAEPLRSLIGLRVVVPEDTDPVPRWNPSENVPIQTLVLHITHSCNLGCVYCYHGTREKVSGKKAVMDLETAFHGIDLLMDRSGDLDTVTLVLFGGEPLLRFEDMKSITAYARRKASERNKTVRLALTTNGVLLTEEIVRFLRDEQVSVTVSIDGPPDVHDRYRPFPDGKPSLKAVSRGVERLIRNRGQMPVAARVTVAHSPAHVTRTLDYLLEMGFSEVGFSPVTTHEVGFQLQDEAMNELLAHFRQISERFLATARSGNLLGFTNLIDLLVNLHEGKVKTHPCGAGLGMFSVGVDGQLYLCQRLTGSDQFSMGNVFDGLDSDRVIPFRKRGSIENRAGCHSCPARSVCAGGCYHEALIRQGSLTTPNRHYCRWIRKWLDIGLDTYARLCLENSDYLDKLSLLRGHAPYQAKAFMH